MRKLLGLYVWASTVLPCYPSTPLSTILLIIKCIKSISSSSARGEPADTLPRY